ncbi:hypothetical protein [[Eubacterium] cellulosolvens]
MKIENAKMRGFYAGLIAGCIGFIVFYLALIPQTIIGLPTGVLDVLDLFKFDHLIAILGFGIPSNGIWGGIYGIIFSIFYNRVPGSGVKKGFFWGCIIGFISDLWIAFGNFLLFLMTGTAQFFIWGYGWCEAFIIWASYGVVLGMLYERWK